jgi:hypothetical protein
MYLVVTMPPGSYSLGETAAKEKMVRLVCHKCATRRVADHTHQKKRIARDTLPAAIARNQCKY